MTAHVGVIPSDQADKLYSYPALNKNAGYELRGDGSWGYHYANCDTVASEPAKVATCPGFVKKTGNWVVLRNANSNTASTLTLNINNTGAVGIFNRYFWASSPAKFVCGMYLLLVGNNGAYFIVSGPINSEYLGWFVCNTAAATADKVVTMTGFMPVAGATFPLYVDKTNTAETVTLNINGTGAMEIVDCYGEPIDPANFVKGIYTMGVTGGGKYVILSGPHRAVNGFKYFDGFGFTGYGNVNRFINCTTAAATAAKTVSTSAVVQYMNGLTVNMFLKNANSAANPTLNINSLGDIPIVNAKGAALTGASLTSGLHNLVYYDAKFYDIGV